MTHVPAARFENSASDHGNRGTLREFGAFVEANGVGTADRDRIAHTLAAVLRVAAGHASPDDGTRIALVADVTQTDVQIVLSLRPQGRPAAADPGLAGGFELWISFLRN
jgi:hypothetical protein